MKVMLWVWGIGTVVFLVFGWRMAKERERHEKILREAERIRREYGELD